MDQPLPQQPASNDLRLQAEQLALSVREAIEKQILLLEEYQARLQPLEVESDDLLQHRNTLRSDVTGLAAKKADLAAENEQAIANYNVQLADLQAKISKAQDMYEQEVKRLNTLRQEIDEEEEAKEAAIAFKEDKLKEKSLALQAKTDAFLQDRADFETEKRRFASESAMYDTI